MKHILSIFFFLGALHTITLTYSQSTASFDTLADRKPAKVMVKAAEGRYQFYVNDQPLALRGVGINYVDGHDFEALYKAGGNAFRTWGTDHAAIELAAAKKYGFMVALGIKIEKELYGFDYNDEAAVAKQLERVKKTILAYKNHPNLLCWVVGNELNLLLDEDGALKEVNPKVYDAVADIVAYIHEVDPNHPVTTTFAGVHKSHLKEAVARCPDLEIISVQVYQDLARVEELIVDAGIEKPYMITEYGPRGFWEMPKTAWKREIEEPSGPKADGIFQRIHTGIINNQSGKCLGGFAFEWGQKHERTPTWFGMFDEEGRQTENIDNLTKLWTGAYPSNRAPRVDSLLLDNQRAENSIYLAPDTKYSAKVFASDPDGDELVYKWEIAEEVKIRSNGGAKEIKPPRIPVRIEKDANGELVFYTPKKEGAYRILVYVYDQKHKLGNANIPFYIKNTHH